MHQNMKNLIGITNLTVCNLKLLRITKGVSFISFTISDALRFLLE